MFCLTDMSPQPGTMPWEDNELYIGLSSANYVDFE